MTTEQYVESLVGKLTIQNAALLARVDELTAQVADLHSQLAVKVADYERKTDKE